MSSSDAILQELFQSVRGKRTREDEDRSEEEEESRRVRRSSSALDRMEESKKRHRRERRRMGSQEERPPVRTREDEEEEDVFWDSKWDAMQIQKKAEEQERKGRHYLDSKALRRESSPPKRSREKDRRRRYPSSSPECDELIRLKKYKDIQSLVVREDERYVENPPDPSLFEWDSLSRMWKRKSESSSGSRKKSPEVASRRGEEDEMEEGELPSEEDESHGKEEESKRRKKKKSHSESRKSRRRRSRSSSRSRHRSRRSSSRTRRHSRSSHHRRHGRHRSRSPSRDDNYFRTSRSAIDKEKLLAIAKKNAVKLLSSNNLMGMDHNCLVAAKSGSQSLPQLINFCRELAKKGLTDEFSESEHHDPFELKERPLPNVPCPNFSLSSAGETLTPAAKMAAKSHRMMEFPVSSGNDHRVKETDVKEEEKDKDEAKKEEEDKPPEVSSIIKEDASKDPTDTSNSPKEEAPKKEDPLPPPPVLDIGSIVSQRLNAIRKLNENPLDPEALKAMDVAQKEVSNWAVSKNRPGQFTGHTGARVLSRGELSTGIQAWARQEQFSSAQKVSGGFGEFMLRKMGWSEGEGLGKDKSGDVDPLTLDIKMDKKGLMSLEEGLYRRKNGGSVLTMTACKDLSCKHPVSALMELATKRRWGPPNFVQAFECGPPHKKQYIYKVTVNGIEYQPTIACENKKKAKSDAATFTLQEMGLLAKDPNNPL